MTAASVPRPTLSFTGFLHALAGFLGLTALALLAWTALAPPAVPIVDPAWLARVAEHKRVLEASTRPIATPDNARARAYLVAQLQAMGLAPAVQRANVRKSVVYYFGGTHITIGVVHNIVVTIRGRAPDAARRPALLLATHYDSNDARRDAGAAALLETARALHAAPPANDVVLLFADGEQVGALGAKGFVEQHRLARRIGLALKFDDAVDGPPRMVEASGAAPADWMRAAPEVRGSSFEATLTRLLNDRPRLGPLAGLDAPALLFAGDGAGDAMLRLARTYGAAPSTHGAQAAQVYFSLPIVGPVHHPAWLVWAPAILSCLMLAGAWRRLFGQDGTAEAAQGVFGVCFLLLVVRMGTWNWRHELADAGSGGEHRLPLLVAALAACAFVAGLYLLRRSIGPAALALGALAWPALVLLPAAGFVPGAAYVLAWPLVAALGAFTLLHTRWGERQGVVVRLAVLLAGLAPAAVLLPAALRDAWLLLAPQRLYLPALLIALPMLCFAGLLPLLRIGPAVIGMLALVVAASFALPGHAANVPPRPERGEELVYYKDMNTWRAYWLLPQQPLTDWRRALFPERRAPTVFVEVFGLLSPPQWYAVAPRDDTIAYPACFILRNSVGKVRLARFTLRSTNRAPHIELRMVGAKALRSRLDGAPLTAKESGWTLSLYGMEDRLLQIEIESAPDEIFAVTVQERMPGLPRHLLPPAAAGAVAPQAGQTLSTDILRFY